MSQTTLANIPEGYSDTLPDMREEIYKTVNDAALNLWLFIPEGHTSRDRRPAVVFLHGGGWLRGHPSQFYKHCEYLAARGMVAITAAYRVREKHGSTIAQSVADTKSVIRWVRTHADRLGIDPNRLVVGGSSAGGHLAAAAATLDIHDDPADDLSVDIRPNAMVLFNPALVLASVAGKLDIADWTNQIQNVLGMPLDVLLGAPPESLSPYHHIKPGMGPTLMFHGMADMVVPYVTTALFHEKMKACGNPCTLIGYQEAGHGFSNYRQQDNAPFIHVVHEMDRFLVSLGYLQDVPENIRYT